MWQKLFSKRLDYKVIPFYKKLPNKQELIFVHIPKTAGTSLKRTLGMPPPGKSNRKYRKHHTIQEMRNILPDEVWQRAFKFSIIRNPWDRAVSHYLFNKRKAAEKRGNLDFVSFSEWIHRKLENPSLNETIAKPQTAWLYNEDNQLLVDYVGRFESLEKTYQEICEALQIKVPATLRHLNVSNYNGKTYRDFYDEDTKALIARVCAADVENFGYKY